MNKDWKRAQVFTTGDVAKICNLSIAKVNSLFDLGLLQGFKIPGSSHRRIPRKNIIEFIKKYKLPFLHKIED
jgi:hypothetical protein